MCGAGFGGVALHGVGSTDLEMRECTDGVDPHNPRWSRIFWNSAAASVPWCAAR
jgi:hypothetical protein